jgi:serine/threonine protein kinase
VLEAGVNVAASGDADPFSGGFVAGASIAGYRLEQQVGAGGMAVVFRAVDERLGRQVALKILAPALAADPAFRQRFIAESRAAAAVDDPHIIPVYEAGEAAGLLFIAMRYVPGGDVRTILAREGPMSPERAVGEIISPVALALDAAHAAGLVHRDVKPPNMLVDVRPDRPDHVYLSDFGLTLAAESLSVTGSGQFLGTPLYASPEQIQGRTVDGRTDQYALACSAFAMLTGEPPFVREQGMAVLFAHMTEPPPLLTSRRPGIPPEADKVMARALAKNPAERYRSCREFADALMAAFGLITEADRRRAWARPTELPVSGKQQMDPGHLTRTGPSPTSVPDAAAPSPVMSVSAPGADTQTTITRLSPRPTLEPAAKRADLPFLTAWLSFRRWLAVTLRTFSARWRSAGPSSSAGPASPAGPSAPGAFHERPRIRTLDVPLKPSFRYVHEPSRAGEDALPPLGNEMLIEELQSRILHSRGGAFLITGFRGVGKSTLVLKALDGLASRAAARELVLPVVLSVARATTTERLLFAIVRRVFETLNDSGVLGQLPAQTRHALIVAYMRTSLSFKETQSDARERSAGLDLSLGPGKAVKAIADLTVPKISMSAKRSHSLAMEAAFLAYSETDVEYDLMRIVSLVDQRAKSDDERHALLWRLRPSDHQNPAQPHLVIVLDEVDKLTADKAGIATIEDLLTGIKNVLTMPGVHFLMVAGPDLHDRALRDAARGNGVYESVFGWRLYVPCVWDAPDRLMADIIRADTSTDADTVESLTQYLRFKARGVPRRLLQEVNGFIVWEENCPRLRINAMDIERIEFYARLERILRDYFKTSQQKRLFPVAIDEDRWRLGGYYVVDWVLQSEGEPFSAADLLREGEEAEFDPLLRISRRNVDRLLDHLVQNRVLDVVREMNGMATVIGDIAESGVKVFRLADEIRQLLYGFAAQHEAERAGHDVSLALATMGRQVQYPNLARRSPKVIAGRYELGDLLRQGGITSSYKGRDVITGRQVEVKLLRPALSGDPVARARFQRDADILQRLSHPQIVRVYDVLHGPEQDPVVITEWLHGPSLQQLIADDGPMPPSQVAAVGRILAEVLNYAAGNQVVRLDLKPSTIVMADRGPVIVDLGIAIRLGEHDAAITEAGQFVGTPEFMAPELLEGRDPDPQADIYSLGLILYYCITGKVPWEGMAGRPALMIAIRTEDVDMTDLPISPEFREALARAVVRDRDTRFSHATDLRDALTETPEYRSLAGGPDSIDEI